MDAKIIVYFKFLTLVIVNRLICQLLSHFLDVDIDVTYFPKSLSKLKTNDNFIIYSISLLFLLICFKKVSYYYFSS